MTKILFAGGGSVGHLAPSVAVLRAMQKIDPSVEAHFVCSEKEDDAMFLQKEGLAFSTIPAMPLKLGIFRTAPAAIIKARSIVRECKPDVVFCKGGSLGVPVALAARRFKIPIVLHESDAVSGYANRLISFWAKKICLGFPTNQRQTTNDKRIFTGNPVRPEITKGSRADGKRLAGFNDDKPILLILGGSQGAKAINDAILSNLDSLLKICNIIHLTGRGKETSMKRPGYWSLPFAQQELPHLYAAANIAVSRAGAGSISELAAAGIPCILIPLRGVGHDHQMKNARAVEQAGGCVLLHQEHLSTTLVPAIRRLMDHADERDEMAKRLALLHHRDASKEIAEILLHTVGKKT